MNRVAHIGIEDFRRLCADMEEESLTIEFKPCNELKAGTDFRDRRGITRDRLLQDVLDELTKDVSAFLNSAGGTIIYGILDSKSRAQRIDDENAFKLGNSQDDIRAEKVIQWLRAHVAPPPLVDVYSVLANPGEVNSPWYIVIEIPQGQTAYMAKDHKFYRRVGSTAQPMEQYEVVDVMNRTRAATLDVKIESEPRGFVRQEWEGLDLRISVTSTNFIASEYGQLKIILGPPVRINRRLTCSIPGYYPSGYYETFLLQERTIPGAEGATIRWGANIGNIIFPGDWHDFNHHPLFIELPSLSQMPNPTYLLQAQLFTMNSQGRQFLYAIQQQRSTEFHLFRVEPQDEDRMIAAYLDTHKLAQENPATRRQVG